MCRAGTEPANSAAAIIQLLHQPCRQLFVSCSLDIRCSDDLRLSADSSRVRLKVLDRLNRMRLEKLPHVISHHRYQYQP